VKEVIAKLDEILRILQGTFVGRAPRCPDCGSPNTFVASTVDRIRYCKCRDCAETFKAIGPPK